MRLRGGGGRGIRTHGTVSRASVFETKTGLEWGTRRILNRTPPIDVASARIGCFPGRLAVSSAPGTEMSIAKVLSNDFERTKEIGEVDLLLFDFRPRIVGSHRPQIALQIQAREASSSVGHVGDVHHHLRASSFCFDIHRVAILHD